MRSAIMFASSTTTAAETPQAPVSSARSAWHSPVPYLFGGLAAMLGLIAVALLILACSYWKVYRNLDSSSGNNTSAGDEKKPAVVCAGPRPVLPEGFFVIMPGDVGPTHLATPMMMTRWLQMAASVSDDTGHAPVMKENVESEAVSATAASSSSSTEEPPH